MNKIRLYLCILPFLFSINAVSQVTIGSGIAPAKGALLDLKQNDQKNNSTKGVLFPRVLLSSEHELYPMFGENGTETQEYSSNKNKLKEEHKGLIVYNLSEENDFNEGLYIWDGTLWKSFVQRVVLPPAIDELLCDQAKLSPAKFDLESNYEGMLTIPYIGGNGMNYASHTQITDGLTFELISGSLNVGQGLLYYKVTGIPNAKIIELNTNFAKNNCTTHIESESDIEIKAIEYVRKRVDVVNDNEINKEKTVVTLGNLQIRYNKRSGYDLIEFRTLENTYITYQYTKHGEGGNYLYRYNQVESIGLWLDFGHGNLDNTTVSNTSKDISLSKRDIATATFILHNTREVYRLTVNANTYIEKSSNTPEVPARISFFIERLE